tara:strand:+ start:1361 stop:2704 length:1344 start_codon:yes stop_codon:yes gene_type:complete
MMFGSLATNFISISIHSATYRYYFKDKNEFPALNFSNLVFVFIVFIVFGLFVWIKSENISQHIFDNKVSSKLIVISYIGGCIAYFYNYFKELLIYQNRSKEYAIITILTGLINPLLALIFIFYFSLTYLARIYGIIFAQLLVFALIVYLQREYFRIEFSKILLKKSIKFSYPQLPSGLISLTQKSFDKTMLTNLKNLDVVGHYQLGQKLGSVGKNLISAIGRSWVPYFMKNAEINSEKSKSKILDRYYEIITIYNYLCIAICFFAEETVKVFTTREFYPSMYIIPIYVTYILITHVIGALCKPQITYAEKLNFTLPAPAIAVMINIIANLILIPSYGAIGAMIATLISGSVSSIIWYYFGQKAYPLPIKINFIIKQLILYVIFIIIVYYLMFHDFHFLSKVLLKCFFLLFYFYLSIRFGFIKKERVIYFYSLIKRNSLSFLPNQEKK